MLKILTWVVSNDSRFFNGAMNILERQHNGVEVVGVTANVPIVKDGKKVTFIPLAEVDGGGDYDLILVVGARQIGMNKITQAARQFRLPEEKLLGDWIVCIPGFTLKKYRQLQRSRLSIFSMNCFGGLISHTLGLPFLTPFINMYTSDKEFVRFLRAARVYMEERLVLKETAWQEALHFDYPIVTLGNIDIHMNHYSDFDEAVKIWKRRKARINWYNLFVTAYTESEEILQEFDDLPYSKKVCFVPFKSNLDSAWYITPQKDLEFWNVVNQFGTNPPFYYDVFDMLLYGKKTQLIDM
ncbi:MAG: DUF1919 domain-containing protein [Selenomonadaceae bacterium]|nr:DUF1919 domain-containing protein [Selenomonadaceae bacterium]